MAQILLAEALLRRKELQEKVDQLRRVKEEDLHELVIKRRQVNDQIDDIQASVPKVSIGEVTAAFDWHARQLRLVDAAIQQANWTTEITVADTVTNDFDYNGEK